MFHRAKYIIVESEFTTMPIVFPEYQQHSDMAMKFPNSKVIGAGFCNIRDNKFFCHGESISLGVKADQERDSRILNRHLGVEND